jgi:hypothetical protein
VRLFDQGEFLLIDKIFGDAAHADWPECRKIRLLPAIPQPRMSL